MAVRSLGCVALCRATLIAFLVTSTYGPVASAGIIGTDEALAPAAAAGAISTTGIEARTQLEQRLVGAGVDQVVVAQRVAALTDDEVAMLNARFEQLPAGGYELTSGAVLLLIAIIVGLVVLLSD